MCEWPPMPSDDDSQEQNAQPRDGHAEDASGGHNGDGHSDCCDVTGVLSRRTFLATGAASLGTAALNPLAAAAAGSSKAQPVTIAPATGPRDWSGTHVVLLGTGGGPVPMSGRSATSQAVVVDGNAYVIDCGEGTVRHLIDAGIPYGSVRGLFITHLHSDHIADYFPTLVCGRPIGPQPGFSTQVQVYGPGRAGQLPPLAPGVSPVNPANPTAGTVDVTEGVLDAYSYTVNIMYIKSQTGPDIRDLVAPHDIPLPNVGASPTGPLAPDMSPFEVYRDENVVVNATLVNHPPVFPSFAFRFDTPYGSVTFSGDCTSPSPNLQLLAENSDLLVHEIMNMQAMLDHGVPAQFVNLLHSTHTDVTEVGQVANGANVGQLALSHIVPVDPLTAYPPEPNPGQWLTPIKRNYDGPVTLGHDLLTYSLGTRRGRRTWRSRV